jgi:TolB protein
MANVKLILREAGGATRVLNLSNGALVATPAFSQPDGATLIYAVGRENGIDLFAVNPFTSEPPRRVSVGRGRDSISPTFSSDGRQIAFTSDRAGPKNVYISDADGTNAEPLIPAVIGDQSYRSDPDWSPDGRLIAFQSQIDGNFQLMTIGVRDRAIKRYTSTGVNENPSWAPDSRHLVFTSTRSGTRQLWVVDVESGRFRQLTHATGAARMGAWSRTLTTR